MPPVADDKLSVGYSDPVVMPTDDTNHTGVGHLTYNEKQPCQILQQYITSKGNSNVFGKAENEQT